MNAVKRKAEWRSQNLALYAETAGTMYDGRSSLEVNWG